MRCDAVFEGGGVRGVAYAGALRVFRQKGWRFRRVAGTSAGAITAALIACGKSDEEIAQAAATDLHELLDARFLRRLWDTLIHSGQYRGSKFEKWLDDLFDGRTMRELASGVEELRIITCDVENRERVVISSRTHPHVKMSHAVRMSMSIPLMFRPVRFADRELTRLCIDGGIVDNFPVDEFDVDGAPRWPTVGFRLDERRHPEKIQSGIELGLRLFSIAREAQAKWREEHNSYRTVAIDDCGIGWLKFNLTPAERSRLAAAGEAAALAFFERWETGGGFDGYARRFRPKVERLRLAV